MRKSIFLVLALLSACLFSINGAAMAVPPGGAANPFAGAYEGVFSANSGPNAPAIATLRLSVANDGTVTGSVTAGLGGPPTSTFTGTVTLGGLLTLTQPGGQPATFQLTADPTTHIVTAAQVTSADGTQYTMWLIKVPATQSPFAATYSGNYTNATGQVILSMSVGNNGFVTLNGVVTPVAGSISTIGGVGFSDNAGNIITAYISSGTKAIGVGTIQLTGTTLTYMTQEYVNGAVHNAPVTVTLTRTALGPAGPVFNTGVNFFSMPADFTGQTLDSLFGYASPRMAVWDPVAGSYSVTPDGAANSVVPGIGYWVRFPFVVTITAHGTPTPTNAPFHITLHHGWNQVGNPFEQNVPLSSLSITPAGGSSMSFTAAQSSGLVPVPVYGYDGTAYTNATALNVYQGYWIYVSSDATLTVPATAPPPPPG